MAFTEFDFFMLSIGSMLIGIMMLVYGGNWTIDAAIYNARRFGISPLVVGFTIVAFGTSLPELIVSIFANLQGSAGIAIGNVLGSNIANILLVIGMTAIFATLAATGRALHRDLIMMMLCTFIMAGFLIYGEFTRIVGLGMLVFLGSYVLYQYRHAKKSGAPPPEEVEEAEFDSDKMAILFLIIGLVAIALGAEFLVRGAKYSAHFIGVPEAVIALSIIAFGTSLPELSTCIVAGRKGHSDIVLGNIVGSNVFNILMIIGFTALIKPIAAGSFAEQLANFDIWVTLSVSLLFTLIIFLYKKITPLMGWIFLSSYILYNIYIYWIYVIPS